MFDVQVVGRPKNMRIHDGVVGCVDVGPLHNIGSAGGRGRRLDNNIDALEDRLHVLLACQVCAYPSDIGAIETWRIVFDCDYFGIRFVRKAFYDIPTDKSGCAADQDLCRWVMRTPE